MNMFEIAFYTILFALNLFNIYLFFAISNKVRHLEKDIDVVNDDSVKRDIETLDYIGRTISKLEYIIKTKGKPEQSRFNQHNFSTREGEHDHV